MKKIKTIKGESKLAYQARLILQERAKVQAEVINKQHQVLKTKRDELRQMFLEGFKDIIPLLDDAEITFEAQFKDNDYPDLYGGHISFKYKGQELKMDFNTGISYRYEYSTKNDRNGRSVYGNWPHEDFIVWIYRNLINKAQEEEQSRLAPNTNI
jgi:hypothetical protein